MSGEGRCGEGCLGLHILMTVVSAPGYLPSKYDCEFGGLGGMVEKEQTSTESNKDRSSVAGATISWVLMECH